MWPADVTLYASKAYWEKRFQKEEEYDWLCDYSHYSSLLKEHINLTDKILVLGCGNSKLSWHLYTAGFTNITNIDYSECVIAKMTAKYSSAYPNMKWQTMDMLAMTFVDDSFDVVIEKATLDTFLVENRDPWNVSKEMSRKMDIILSKVSAMLKHGGRFISITFAQPHFRKKLLSKAEYHWSISTKTFGSNFHFYIYTMTKGQQLKPEDQEPLRNKCDRSNNLKITEENQEEFITTIMNIDF